MARLICFALIITVNVLICVLAEEEHYPERYDHVDVNAILQNKDLRDEYYNCFMEIAPCKTLKQQRLTALFSEAYQTKCRKCTPKQLENMNAVTDWFVTNEPDKWQLIVEKTVKDLKKQNADQ